jgi:predicted secreted hydrolase
MPNLRSDKLKPMKEKIIVLSLIACLTACVPPVYQNPYPIEAIVLPGDDASHAAPVEWWYYTGHFSDDVGVGHDYGFELAFFKAYAPPGINLLGFIPAFVIAEKGHVAHFAITDKSSKTFEMAQKADFWGYEAATSAKDLDITVANWYSRRSPDGLSHEIFATLGNRQLKLILSPEKPAALHGNPPGIQSMGQGGVSYYFSNTRMSVKGELGVNCTLLGCDAVPVMGQAWHDHQWGDFDLSGFAGWDWFSIQFDNDTELMLYLIRQPDGSYTTEAGSFITLMGETVELKNQDFEVKASKTTWTSQATGAVYPLEWQVSVPRYAIDIGIKPIIPDQEMDTRASTGIVYWEGAVEVLGSHSGVGYVELTNYDVYPYGLTDSTTALQKLRGPFSF